MQKLYIEYVANCRKI